MRGMIHLKFSELPKLGDRISVNGKAYDVRCVAPHGQRRFGDETIDTFTIDVQDAFAQGVVYRSFSGELC